MTNLEIETQIYYLNRIFEILSDGYMISIISFNSTEIKGEKEKPFTQINDDLKRITNSKELETLLDYIFSALYEHTKLFTTAPKTFSQTWNNDYILKSISETKNNILKYADNTQVVIKTAKDITNDHYQIIEFINSTERKKEVIFFQTWFH